MSASVAPLPDWLRSAPIIQPVSARQLTVITAAPHECPACHVARMFFVVFKNALPGPWSYRCSQCHDDEARGAA